MSAPNKEQLAPNIDPMLREYIDAVVRDAVTDVKREFSMQAAAMALTDSFLTKRMGEMELFERQVRSHLGIFVPE